jgi:hypothetical protein
MNSIIIRQAQKLEFFDPRKALLFALVQRVMFQHPHLPQNVQDWRTKKLQPELLKWQAALFCFGRKCIEAADKWEFAVWPEQNSDIDYVLRQTKSSGEIRFEFVQFKELVPDEINPEQSLQDLLDKLPEKYPSIGDFTIAINLYRNTTTNVDDLKKPHLPGGSLWLFGLGGEPPNNAFLYGDWLKTPSLYYFAYPTFPPGASLTQLSELSQ